MNRRPKPVTLDNPEVLPYYATKGPNQNFMQGFHALMDTLFNPQVFYASDSEDAIEEHMASGKPALLSLGHVNWFDPCHMAAVVRNEDALRPMIGNIVIPANASYFNKPAFGTIFTLGGAIPTFRKKDVYGAEQALIDEAVEARRIEAGKKLIEITVENYRRGRHVAYFSEGTRNRGDRTKIQPIQNGIVRLANEVNGGEGVMMVCMSPFYGEKRWRDLHNPTVGIGHLAIAPGVQLTNDTVRSRQQECLDVAIAAY